MHTQKKKRETRSRRGEGGARGGRLPRRRTERRVGDSSRMPAHVEDVRESGAKGARQGEAEDCPARGSYRCLAQRKTRCAVGGRRALVSRSGSSPGGVTSRTQLPTLKLFTSTLQNGLYTPPKPVKCTCYCEPESRHVLGGHVPDAPM